MTEQERIDALIKYLYALAELSTAGIKVYGEIQRTNAKIEELLN